MIETAAILLMFITLAGAGIAGIFYFYKDLKKPSQNR